MRDKDGITAALRLAYLAAQLRDAGSSVPEMLDDLARRHGLHATNQLAIRVADVSLIADAMARLRAAAPAQLAGSPVVTVTDLSVGSAELPPTDGLLYLTAQNDRVIIRPSGTEPKLKCYLEVIVPVADPRTSRPPAGWPPPASSGCARTWRRRRPLSASDGSAPGASGRSRRRRAVLHVSGRSRRGRAVPPRVGRRLPPLAHWRGKRPLSPPAGVRVAGAWCTTGP